MDDEEMVHAIMESMPPVEWAELATKSDLALLGRELRGEMAELRGEMGELRGEMRGDMSGVRGEMAGLRGEMSELRGEMSALRGDLSADLASFLRTMVFMMIGLALTIWISLLVA
jgi:hypothetical protein